MNLEYSLVKMLGMKFFFFLKQFFTYNHSGKIILSQGSSSFVMAH